MAELGPFRCGPCLLTCLLAWGLMSCKAPPCWRRFECPVVVTIEQSRLRRVWWWWLLLPVLCYSTSAGQGGEGGGGGVSIDCQLQNSYYYCYYYYYYWRRTASLRNLIKELSSLLLHTPHSPTATRASKLLMCPYPSLWEDELPRALARPPSLVMCASGTHAWIIYNTW
jgi:hypothetical protein